MQILLIRDKNGCHCRRRLWQNNHIKISKPPNALAKKSLSLCNFFRASNICLLPALWACDLKNFLRRLMNYEKKIIWSRILNPTNMSILFNPRKLVPTKIKPSTVLVQREIATIWTNCSNFEESMRFGTQVVLTSTKRFSYSAKLILLFNRYFWGKILLFWRKIARNWKNATIYLFVD